MHLSQEDRKRFRAYLSLDFRIKIHCNTAINFFEGGVFYEVQGTDLPAAIYVGSDLTADGSTMFACSEDIANSYNKLFFVSPAGANAEGEVYQGCYGFTWIFTHDSYTAFSDDNGYGVDNICPDCGGTHKHIPYQATGTNEMGVTVSATETIGGSEAVEAVDPFADAGIEEAEIVTVVLGEAATAKEGVELLLSIYDEAGCCGGSGLFIADQNETWYIENVTGHQYIALKLSSSMAFAQPNMAIIGLIDLDDTENVIASEDIIAVAQEAGTYVGDAEANTIDYVASYCGGSEANSRMVSALNYFNAETASETPASTDYTISNVDAEGNIVPMYTNITLDHAYTIEDVVGYYHIDGIASTRNLETHIFQIFPEDGATDTVEWVAMDDAGYSVFVPYYPMLTTDTYAGYQVSTLPSEFTENDPGLAQPSPQLNAAAPADAKVYYPTTTTVRTEEGRETVEGFCVLPEDWADSMYWSLDALSNLVLSGGASEEQIADVNAKLAEAQQQCYDAFAEMQAAVSEAADEAAAQEAATSISEEAAANVHAVAVELVKGLAK